MKRVVDIYVESISGSGNYSKLELFNDEKIELTSSIQNIQDISKVYTDFTQSFTIPASTINNSILHHFYQSDIDIPKTNGAYQWNFNFRIRAKIEIDLVPFRTGTIMVEKSEIKNGMPDSYTITFYGDLVTLKDKFGESKLSDLDLSAYDISYTGPNVISKITTDADSDLMFPLISSKRQWSYNDSTSTDVNKSATAINYTELFPALKVRRILEAIATKFGLTFNSSFFTSTNDRWDKLYMLLKNEEEYSVKTSSQIADLTYPNGQVYVPGYSKSIGFSTTTWPQMNGFYFDTTSNTFTCQNVGVFGNGWLYPILQVSTTNCTDTTTTYYIDLYRNGILVKSLPRINNQSQVTLYSFVEADNGAVFQIKFKSVNPMSLTLNCNLNYSQYNNFNQSITYNTITTTAYTDIHSKIPVMTISDFFSGILKMFNSTCYATDKDVFTLEPLDTWYSSGSIYNITTYTDIDSISVERQNIYKKLSFKYEKSESFMNRQYYDNNQIDKEYSDTYLTLSNEGSELDIQLPFENLLMNSFDLAYFDVGYCLTKGPDYKPYIPKPVLLYKEGYRYGNVYLNNGSSATQYSQFNIFNSYINVNGTRYTLNFHSEIDTQSPNNSITDTLYKTYYAGYLDNLFNPKSRLLRVKAHFPLSLITKLKLNDRLVIRDKRYIINELKSDITSGEVSLGLINDFRPMINEVETVIIDSTGGTTTKWVGFNVNTVNSVDISTTYSGVTISDSNITAPSNVDITIPANSNTPTPIVGENGTDVLITADGWGIANEEGGQAVIPIDFTYNNNDGTSFVNTLNLYQE
ncbi:hypothetical protein UFOVP207_56 [uncultured Caudovirales phage]|uniref:Uncharacterized protein n=1 Tax=uncultured Caudovirales phage TaxID=2100421 RepID=A0A6J7WMV6_9CAUD|nr:hypothetical protein UFOVP207_56 [uncultured Caudovirales phage]